MLKNKNKIIAYISSRNQTNFKEICEIEKQIAELHLSVTENALQLQREMSMRKVSNAFFFFFFLR
jgi:hypothetical protein